MNRKAETTEQYTPPANLREVDQDTFYAAIGPKDAIGSIRIHPDGTYATTLKLRSGGTFLGLRTHRNRDPLNAPKFYLPGAHA